MKKIAERVDANTNSRILLGTSVGLSTFRSGVFIFDIVLYLDHKKLIQYNYYY